MTDKKIQRIVVEMDGECLSETAVRAFFAGHGTIRSARAELVSGGERLQTEALAEQLGHAQQAQKLEQCAELIRRAYDPKLLEELGRLADSLGQKNPLGTAVVRLRQIADTLPVDHWWTAADDAQRAAVECITEEIERAHLFTEEKKDFLQKIQQFLVPIPADPAYRRLQLAQDLVREHFRLDALIVHPNLVEGPLAAAFSEFHRMYVRQYREEWTHFSDEIVALRKHKKTLLQRAHAVEQLSKVPALKKEGGQVRRVERFFEALPALSEEDLASVLDTQPTVGTFVLGMRAPKESLNQLTTKIEETLEAQLNTLRGLVAKKVLGESAGNDSVKKLLDLLALSQLDELTRLVTGRSGDALVAALVQITTNTQ